jgi:hypothetical protein
LDMVISYPIREGEDRLQLEEIDLELRRSAGDLQQFQSDLRRSTEEIPMLASFILNKTADTIAKLWRTEREVDGAELLRATATDVAVEVAGEVRAKLLKTGEVFQQELSKTAALLSSADAPRAEDFRVLAEMPVFHMNRQDNFAGRPLWARFGRWFGVTAAKRRLQSYESSLNQALESFSRLLYSWGGDASSDLERRFDGFANRYRAQLERLLLDRSRTTIDLERVKSDVDTLTRMFIADVPAASNEAIAS